MHSSPLIESRPPPPPPPRLLVAVLGSCSHKFEKDCAALPRSFFNSFFLPFFSFFFFFFRSKYLPRRCERTLRHACVAARSVWLNRRYFFHARENDDARYGPSVIHLAATRRPPSPRNIFAASNLISSLASYPICPGIKQTSGHGSWRGSCEFTEISDRFEFFFFPPPISIFERARKFLASERGIFGWWWRWNIGVSTIPLNFN